jgi:hypothetical protein
MLEKLNKFEDWYVSYPRFVLRIVVRYTVGMFDPRISSCVVATDVNPPIVFELANVIRVDAGIAAVVFTAPVSTNG